MSKGGKRGYLARALSSHVESIQETFQMLDKSADSSLDKVDWSQVSKLGDEISKQATVAGMLWTGEEVADAKELEENMGAYFNVLHGFILLCHGSTVGAGPTLHANIRASAKQVVDRSLWLLTESVSCDSGKRSSIPKLSGSVWEACDALKKTPTTNSAAIGRAVSQVALSIKDVLREMKELKPADADSADEADSAEWARGSNEESSSSEEDGFGDDLSPEEMAVARLAVAVVSDALHSAKELIRFIKGSQDTDSLERVLSYCREMGAEVNELGACLYPPQEMAEMKSIARRMNRAVEDIRGELAAAIDGSHKGLFEAFMELEDSLGRMGDESDDPLPEMARLTV